MFLDVSRALKNPGQSYSFDATVEIAPMEILSDPVEFAPVSVSGEFTGAIESVSVRAQAASVVTTRCSLCLEPVSQPVTAPVEEVFTKEPNPEDPDHRLLEGHTVDLTEVVQDALLLELPIRFLCKADCRGLCPVCGVNLNIKNCSCQEGGRSNNPFSALSELLTEDEEV